MKNEDVFKKEVEAGSLIRYEINEDHNKEVSTLAKMYKAFFDKEAKQFKRAKDLIYYTGGWPKPDSPPRAKKLADDIADSFFVMDFIDISDSFKRHLAARGLKLEYINDKNPVKEMLVDTDWSSDKKRKKIVETNWKELFDYDLPTDPKEFLSALMRRAIDKQGRICELADEIKIDKGELVSSECEIKVGNYVQSVNLKYKKQKGKDTTEEIDKLLEDQEAIKDMLEYFDSNL
jgi:uncharacterized membrane-anchored protein YjiN (DUF445 family)